MKVDIVRMAQEMDLDDGSVTNFLVFRLQNGDMIRAVVTEEGAQSVVNAKVGGGPLSSVELKTSSAPVVKVGDYVSTLGSEPEGPITFGGNDDDPYTPPPFVPPQASVVNRAKPRSVATDEYGYPVLRVSGGVDPNDLSSSHGQDEDGIGQL